MHRFLLIVLMSAAFPAGQVLAQSLTESEVLQSALAQEDFRELDSRVSNEATLSAQAAVPPSNPQFEYSRESLSGSRGNVDESFLWLRQELDLAGVNRRLRQAAAVSAQTHIAEAELARLEKISVMRRYFYRSIDAAERHRQLTEHLGSVADLLVGVEQRVEAGDLSNLDLLRLQREYHELSITAQQFAASAEAEAGALRLLAGLSVSAQLQGGVLPPPLAPAYSDSALTAQPSLTIVNRQQEAAHLQAEAAQRQRWPLVTIGLGQRRLQEGMFRDDGNLFSVAVELPLFSNGNRQLQAAQARASTLNARRAVMQREINAELSRLHTLAQHQRSIAALEEQQAQDTRLSDLSRAAFLSGELTVNQLIDAQRSDLELKLNASDAALQARETYIEWQFLIGETP